MRELNLLEVVDLRINKLEKRIRYGAWNISYIQNEICFIDRECKLERMKRELLQLRQMRQIILNMGER